MSSALTTHLKSFRMRLAVIEQELHEAQRAQEVLQAFAEPLFVLDDGHAVRYANAAARGWLQRQAVDAAAPDEPVGQSVRALFPAKLAEALVRHAPATVGELKCFKLPEPAHDRVLAARVHRGPEVLVVELGYEPFPPGAAAESGADEPRSRGADDEPTPLSPPMAREAQGPLGDILGLATLLQHSILDDRQRGCVQQIQTAAEELQRLLGGEALREAPPPEASAPPEAPLGENTTPMAPAAPKPTGSKEYVTEQLIRAEPRGAQPPAEASEAMPVFGAEGDEALHGLHVLIVDGDSTHCWLLRDQAAAWGMVPHPFIGAEEAVNWVRRHEECDLAIVDEDLPDVRGHELARRLKALRPGMPVILVSTHRQLEEGDAPFEVWLTKPYRQRLLLDTMCELVQSTGSDQRGFAPGEGDGAAPASMDAADAEVVGSPWAGLAPDDPALAFVDEVLRSCRKSANELLQHSIRNTEEPMAAAVQALHTNCQLLDLPRLLTWSSQVHAMQNENPSAMKEPLDALLTELNTLIAQLHEHITGLRQERPVALIPSAGV